MSAARDRPARATVRQRAGVSNGTLFHHFPSRDDLAGAVIAAAMRAHQAELVTELHAATASRDAVAAVVQRHLRWVADNRRLARLLLSAAPQTLRVGLPAPALSANREFFTQIAGWLTARGWTGSPPLTVVASLWLGPAQYYARGWLADPDDSLHTVAADLAAGAWHALAPLLHPEDT
ncbi:TetR/AcrR family transcriptional regulator [Geodermatophilus poikilotrophus]|uniref:Regulatory protein, tetR family n=1 Tax=Geodermatophilus poikilotrophus TaxID=1333667 RepID=A0A1I0AU03_9ACTN|nr:TetR/AcrR family transcriptional regulator [Geodermatophilus poikilotrophus]SES97229.1 regulatory protein, tetR family [Geodermatophilus poikilotrophus]